MQPIDIHKQFSMLPAYRVLLFSALRGSSSELGLPSLLSGQQAGLRTATAVQHFGLISEGFLLSTNCAGSYRTLSISSSSSDWGALSCPLFRPSTSSGVSVSVSAAQRPTTAQPPNQNNDSCCEGYGEWTLARASSTQQTLMPSKQITWSSNSSGVSSSTYRRLGSSNCSKTPLGSSCDRSYASLHPHCSSTSPTSSCAPSPPLEHAAQNPNKGHHWQPPACMHQSYAYSNTPSNTSRSTSPVTGSRGSSSSSQQAGETTSRRHHDADNSTGSSSSGSSDSSSGSAPSWVDKHLPQGMQPYAHLMRLDKPIGSWLLAWPGLW